MYLNEKSFGLNKNMPNSSASISYYSGYNNAINNFDQSNFKPVMRYSNSATCNKTSNLENKSFSSSISSSSSSSSSSASGCQSDQHLNQIYSITNKIASPNLQKKLSPVPHINQNANHNNSSYSTGASNQYDEETENQIDRIINDLKNFSQTEPYPTNPLNQSYRVNNNNSNRLSSYDNHDIQEYLNLNNNSLNPINETNINSLKSVQNNNNNDYFPNNALLPPNILNGCVYSKKRASINGSGNTTANKSKNKPSSSSTNLNDMNQKMSSNLFTKAFSYAKSTKNPNSNSSGNKDTWKSKLGKYLPHQLSNSGQKIKRNNLNDEGCEIIIDDDLYSSYHLTRRNPINRESIATLTTENAKLTNNNPIKLKNNTKLIFSSASNSSSNLTNSLNSSPSSHPKLNSVSRNNLTQENHVTSFTGKTGLSPMSNEALLSKNLKEETTSMLKSESKTNNQDSKPFTINFTNSLNKLMINNGFNSLRKILKFPTSSNRSKQNLTEIFNDPQITQEQTQAKCYSASTTQVPQIGNTNGSDNKTLSSSSFLKKTNSVLKSSQMSLNQSNDTDKISNKQLPSKISKASPPSSFTSSSSRSSSVIVSGSSVSTPSSILVNSNGNGTQIMHAIGQTHTLSRNDHANKKKLIKKQHSFSSTTNAYNFSLFGSSASSSIKNGPHSNSMSNSLNKEQDLKKNLNNLPKRSFHSMGSSEANPRINSPSFFTNKTSNSKESKVKSMFKIYKNVLNKMHKATTLQTNTNSITRQNREKSIDVINKQHHNTKEKFNCFNNNSCSNNKNSLTKSLLLNNELSCVRNECGNVSASTLSGIGYFRRASLSSSSENFDHNQNLISASSDKSAIKLYDGHKSLIKQIEMHKITSNYDSNNNVIHQNDYDDENANKMGVFYKSKSPKANEKIEASLMNASKLVKDSLLSVEEDMMCDMEVASFFDIKKKNLANICGEHMVDINTYNNNYYDQKEQDQTELNISNSNEDLYEYGAFDSEAAEYQDDLDQDELEIEINSDEDSQEDANEEIDEEDNDNNDNEDEDAENLKYLVKQLAAEASLSSINLNGKIIINKKDNNNNYNKFNRNMNIYANNSTNYFNKNLNQIDVEDLVDDLNENFNEPDQEEIEDNFNKLSENENNSINLTDTEIQSIMKSSNVSTESFTDEPDSSLKNSNNLQSINKKFIAPNSSFASLLNTKHNNIGNESISISNQYLPLKKTQPLVKHISSTIVRPVKQYHQKPFEDNCLKKSFNSSILVQKPLIISPIEANSLDRCGITKEKLNENANIFNKIQPLTDINFNNIKIEKKIRLNYRRPDYFNNNTNKNNNSNYLNFGTLC